MTINFLKAHHIIGKKTVTTIQLDYDLGMQFSYTLNTLSCIDLRHRSKKGFLIF